MTLLILAFHAFDGGGTFLPGVPGFARTSGNEPAGCRGCGQATFGGQSAPGLYAGSGDVGRFAHQPAQSAHGCTL